MPLLFVLDSLSLPWLCLYTTEELSKRKGYMSPRQLCYITLLIDTITQRPERGKESNVFG